MRFTLTIKCDNAAFSDDGDDDNRQTGNAARAREIARILRDLAADMVHDTEDDGGKLRDINGNTVGSWSFSEVPADTGLRHSSKGGAS
jgi:hypothetical protein